LQARDLKKKKKKTENIRTGLGVFRFCQSCFERIQRIASSLSELCIHSQYWAVDLDAGVCASRLDC
jgi:hypothetical protein